MDDGHFSYITNMKEKYTNVQRDRWFFFSFFSYRNFGEIKPKISKISRIYTRKAKISQFLCRKIAKSRQKKNTDIIIIIIIIIRDWVVNFWQGFNVPSWHLLLQATSRLSWPNQCCLALGFERTFQRAIFSFGLKIFTN
jgi:hypothetical protein